jgi:hypothetical protein
MQMCSVPVRMLAGFDGICMARPARIRERQLQLPARVRSHESIALNHAGAMAS